MYVPIEIYTTGGGTAIGAREGKDSGTTLHRAAEDEIGRRPASRDLSVSRFQTPEARPGKSGGRMLCLKDMQSAGVFTLDRSYTVKTTPWPRPMRSRG